MDWRHLIVALALVLIGIVIGAKKPGLVSKLSGGMLAA